MNARYSKAAFFYFAAIGVVVVAGALLYWMGHPLICKCNYIKLWHSVPVSSENSQHLSDWYTFSHIIHGIIFYWLLWKFAKKASLGFKFLIAVFIETAWEVFENTNFIINRYRETTVSLDYFGDSVINSVFDILFMMLGFWMARKLPVWVSVLLIIFMEIFVGYFIRDNLTLNIIMLLYPFQFIKNWQM